ncbi:hypothetical protein evm_011011, partial [Chilo suppressalis]
VVKVNVKEPGEYDLTLGSKSNTSVLVEADTDFNFNHGFSLSKPYSIVGTSVLPLPGEKSYLIIAVKSRDNITLDTVELSDLDDNLIMELPLENIGHSYVTKTDFLPPDGLFKITVKGLHVKSNMMVKRTCPIPIEVQDTELVTKENKAPEMIIDKGLLIKAEYNEPLVIGCNVKAYPKPTIMWYDETGSVVEDEVSDVDLPYNYKNNLNIKKVVMNATYTCEAVNSYGKAKQKVQVNAEKKKYFDVQLRPTDTKIEYKKTGSVSCKIDSYPLSEVTWYKDDKLLHNDSNIEISSDGTKLNVKNMTPELNGTYSCKAQNGVNSKAFYFNLIVTGFAPTVGIKEGAKLTIEYNAPIDLECLVTGYPKPLVVWTETNTGNVLPSDIVPSSGGLDYDYISLLKIDQSRKNATYQCLASNDHGKDTKIIEVETRVHLNIEERPKDINIALNQEGSTTCKFDANPPTKITWYKNGVKLESSDSFDIIDDANGSSVLSVKQMKPSLMGNYTCQAVNPFQTEELNFYVLLSKNVPKVNIKEAVKKHVEYNEALNLECKVTGFPEPNIVWKELDSGNILPSKTIPNVDMESEYVSVLYIKQSTKNVTYQCLASNDQGEDSQIIEVETKVYIDVIQRPKNLNIVFRKDGTVRCKVDAKPAAILMWYKNGIRLRSDDNQDVMYLSDGSSMLMISEMKPHLVGNYSCRAITDFQSMDLNFNVMIIGTAPKTFVEGKPKIKVDYDTSLQLLCKASGYPEPDIVWLNRDTGKEFDSTLSLVDPSYEYGRIMKIDKINENATYTCKATNTLGEHSTDVKIETGQRKYFDIIEEPKDTNITYKKSGQVFCRVSANPPADIIWYGGNEKLKNNSHIRISKDQSVLNITDMQPELEERYSCVAKNSDKIITFRFHIGTIGTTKPVIQEIPEESLTAVEGTKVNMTCRLIGGDPAPAITWSFRANGENKTTVFKENVEEITIDNVTRNKSGVYFCLAKNAAGKDSIAFDLEVEYPPTIRRKNKKNITIREGDKNYILYCDTSGNPQPEVVWLLNNAPVDTTKTQIFKDHSISIQPSPINDGEFTCIAKNKHGEANIKINVRYFAPPVISPPPQSKIELLEGKSIELPCEADGYPRPKIRWTFLGFNSTSRPLLLKYAMSPDTLKIASVELERSGYYICNAECGIFSSNMSYEVIVYAPPRITNSDSTLVAVERSLRTSTISSNTLIAVKGDFVLRIPCKATGFPVPEMKWTRNGYLLPSGTKWYDIADDGALLLKNVDEGGTYNCIAVNGFGWDETAFEVIVQDSPTPETPSREIILITGDSVPITCDLPHTPVDQLRWFKNGHFLVSGELTLYSVNWSHGGYYTCRVCTLSGSQSSTINIVVI